MSMSRSGCNVANNSMLHISSVAVTGGLAGSWSQHAHSPWPLIVFSQSSIAVSQAQSTVPHEFPGRTVRIVEDHLVERFGHLRTNLGK